MGGELLVCEVWSVECGVRSVLLAPIGLGVAVANFSLFTFHSSLPTLFTLHFQRSSLNICKGTKKNWGSQKRRGVACENMLRNRGWNVKIRNWRTLSERVGFFLAESDVLSLIMGVDYDDKWQLWQMTVYEKSAYIGDRDYIIYINIYNIISIPFFFPISKNCHLS